MHRNRLRNRTAAALTACMLTCLCFLHTPAAASAEADRDYSYLGSFGSLSEAETAEAASRICDAFRNHSSVIEICSAAEARSKSKDYIGLYREIIHTAETAILHSNSYRYYTQAGRFYIEPSYCCAAEEYASLYQTYTSQIDAIAAKVKHGWSDEEKALFLHDYLAVHYNYDYAALEGKAEREYDEQYSAVGLLRNGKAVCQGYSELYAILLNKVGIPTRFVSSDGLNHAWNYVRIGGTWYHVDVTWDDCYQNRAGIMTHDFFLKTAGELAAQGRHTSTDWILLDQTELYGVQTSSRFSDAFWNGKGMVSDLNGKWAAYDPETHALMAYAYDSSSKTAAGTQLAVLTNSQVRWPVWEAPRSFWSADFVIPVSAGGALYYSTPDTIYTLSGGQPEVFYTLSSTEKQQGYLYGMYEDDGKLYYGIDTVPQDADRTNTAIRYYSLALADAPGQIETTTAATTVTDAATTTAATTTTTAATTTATVSSTTTTHITTTTTSATVTTTAGPLYCDFDRSGSLSAADAVLMLRFINEDWEDSLPVPDAALLRAADLDRDGCLTVHDVMQLFRSL